METLTNFDVVHFTMGNPAGALGISPLLPLGISVRIDQTAQAYQLQMMNNGARLGVLLTLSKDAYRVPEIRESIRQEFTERHVGAANAGKPYVATEVEATTLPQQTAVEADLIKQRLLTREEVSASFQVAGIFLGDSSKATLNNVEQFYKQLYKTSAAPITANICDTLQAQVIEEHAGVAKRLGYTEFDASAILAGDPAERAETYIKMESAGALTINEVRDRENLPQFDATWADEPLLPTNNLQPASLAYGESDDEREGSDPDAETGGE
jgi:HK97 family phage portal protein